MLWAAATDHRYLDGGPRPGFHQQSVRGARLGWMGCGRSNSRQPAPHLYGRATHGRNQRMAPPGKPGRHPG
jgi:hypothetical protein